jgi:hypothetical protein
MKVHSVLALGVPQTLQEYLKKSIYIQGRENFGLLIEYFQKLQKESYFQSNPHLFQKGLNKLTLSFISYFGVQLLP